MRILDVRNVHEALPIGLQLLRDHGCMRSSRNGDVIVSKSPVTTIYQEPMERVLFWAERDANPFFHLYEALWMLNGRNDLAPLLRYVSDFGRFSDDGRTLHGAYGYRWRFAHDPLDQLEAIADRLRRDPDDRRAVLQMWDAGSDLEHRAGKDLPCNLIATFQVNVRGELELTVFCRSNDIIWGAYGANAVHFSLLLEYMSIWTGYPMGCYLQISVNYHAYWDVYRKLTELREQSAVFPNPYVEHFVKPLPLTVAEYGANTIHRVDGGIADLLRVVDGGCEELPGVSQEEVLLTQAFYLFRAHHEYRTGSPNNSVRFERALDLIDKYCREDYDWVIACRNWIQRRFDRWAEKQRIRVIL